jgi:hypothetical protein
LGKEVSQARGRALGCLVEEKLEESLVRLKLLAEEKLDESLVRLKLLAEEKLDESLVRLKLLLEEKMVGSLVRLVLNHADEKNSPQFGSPKFPLQLITRGQVLMKRKMLRKIRWLKFYL